MKRLGLILAAGFLIGGLLAPIGRAIPAKQSAVVEFAQPVKLLDVILRGEYVFVHDEDKMARGEACSYVYTSDWGQPGRLIAYFHCQPVRRDQAERFTVVTGRFLPAMPELREYQFAGSTEGHRVPQR